MKKLIPFLFVALIAAGALLLMISCENKDASMAPQNGVGGSMARFAITGNTLYIVARQSLEVYDISTGDNPAKTASKNISVGIETIFPYQDKLFIGAANGMYIFDNTNPKSPSLLSQYTHVQSCDPVVVQGKYAYVTLRAGVTCRPGGGLSSLDVVDISDPKKPLMINTQTMTSPYGLGVVGDRLFVCEGNYGLKMMDLSDPIKPVLKKHYSDIPSYDVIAFNKQLIVTGRGGLFQYRIDDKNDLELLSKITVQ